MFKISIISINKNNLNGLVKTFNSVVSQSFKKFEFIIIDGESSDGSKEFLEKNSSKIDYWVSENDMGVYHAMNKGLIKATGDYCIFLNSGDRFFSNTVLSEVSNYCASNSNFDLIYGLIAWDHISDIWNPKEGFKPFEITTYSPIPHQGCFFKTSTLKKHGGYEEKYKIISDWCVIFDYISSKAKINKLSLIISICEKQGISLNFMNMISKERYDFLLKKHKKTWLISILYRFKKRIKQLISVG